MSKVIPYVKYSAKAIVAGVVAFAGGAAIAAVDGWTQSELWGVVGTTVAAVGAVFGFGNGPKPDDADPDQD